MLMIYRLVRLLQLLTLDMAKATLFAFVYCSVGSSGRRNKALSFFILIWLVASIMNAAIFSQGHHIQTLLIGQSRLWYQQACLIGNPLLDHMLDCLPHRLLRLVGCKQGQLAITKVIAEWAEQKELGESVRWCHLHLVKCGHLLALDLAISILKPVNLIFRHLCKFVDANDLKDFEVCWVTKMQINLRPLRL